MVPGAGIEPANAVLSGRCLLRLIGPGLYPTQATRATVHRQVAIRPVLLVQIGMVAIKIVENMLFVYTVFVYISRTHSLRGCERASPRHITQLSGSCSKSAGWKRGFGKSI